MYAVRSSRVRPRTPSTPDHPPATVLLQAVEGAPQRIRRDVVQERSQFLLRLSRSQYRRPNLTRSSLLRPALVEIGCRRIRPCSARSARTSSFHPSMVGNEEAYGRILLGHFLRAPRKGSGVWRHRGWHVILRLVEHDQVATPPCNVFQEAPVVFEQVCPDGVVLECRPRSRRTGFPRRRRRSHALALPVPQISLAGLVIIRIQALLKRVWVG